MSIQAIIGPRPATHTLLGLLKASMAPLRRPTGSTRPVTVDHLNDRLLADIGLTRETVGGNAFAWSRVEIRPTVMDDA